MDAFHQAPVEASAQINACEINVTGPVEGEWVHIDFYASILDHKGRVKSVFAPFSHDAEFALLSAPSASTEVHAPGAAFIFAAGFAFLARRRAQKKSA
jgi:hypothetical protein